MFPKTRHPIVLLSLSLSLSLLGCEEESSAPVEPAPAQASGDQAGEPLQAWVEAMGGSAAGGAPNPHAAGAVNPHAGGAPGPHGGGGAAAAAVRGTVTETMNAAGYTYMKLNVGDREEWVAAMAMEVSVGDQVELAGGMTMRNFHSRSLDRTFEEILFVSSARRVEGGEGAAEAAAPAGDESPAPEGEASAPGGAAPAPGGAAPAPQALPAGHPPLGGLPPGHP